MKALKLAVRGAAALAVLGLAAPAFPCTDMKQTTAENEKKAAPKDTVAKADKASPDKAKAKSSGSAAKKSATAAN